MVGHSGIADRAKEDRVKRGQLRDAVFRHHPPSLGIGLAAPVEFLPLKAKAIAPCRGLHRLDALRHHFLADAVAGNHRDPIRFWHKLLFLDVSLRASEIGAAISSGLGRTEIASSLRS